MRNLLISLGVTLSVGVILYIYFNNKLSNIENKMNTIFQLIQSHNNEMQNRRSFEGNGLIEVSDNEQLDKNGIYNDDESESDSESDSDSDSDSESEDDEYEENEENEENLKNSNNIKESEIEWTLEQLDADNKTNETLEVLTEVNLEQAKVHTIDVDTVDVDAVDVEAVDVEAVDAETVDVDAVDVEESGSDSEQNKLTVGNEENEEEEEVEELEEIDTNQQERKKQLSNYKVVDLKEMAQEKGLENYSKLKKSDLVDLLLNSE